MRKSGLWNGKNQSYGMGKCGLWNGKIWVFEQENPVFEEENLNFKT